MGTLWSIMVYKLTILPYIVYAGFLVTSTNIDDKRDLQICQNVLFVFIQE